MDIKKKLESLGKNSIELKITGKERIIDRKIFSIIYLLVAIGFTIILVFAASLPSNLAGTAKAAVVGCFVLLILCCLFMSLGYGRVYIKIRKDEILWRKMYFKFCGAVFNSFNRKTREIIVENNAIIFKVQNSQI